MCKTACMSTEVSTGTIPDITRGDRMRVSLRHASLGVQEMAAYLDVSRNAVSNWINDRVTPSKQTMRLWALRCGVPLEWLETGQAPVGGPGPGAARSEGLEPPTFWLGVSNVVGLAARRATRATVEVERVAA